jgi:hypothetical protein
MKQQLTMMICGLFLMLVCRQTWAQTEKGSWLLSGSGTFQHLHYGDHQNSITIQLFPKAGLFVTNNLAVGLMPALDMNIDENQNPDLPDFKSYTLSIGPFIRYYYPIASK